MGSSNVAPAPQDSPDKPHVLYVAWGFPPMVGGGTYRTLATANSLATAGFDVTVLTADRAAFLGFTGTDPALEDEIDPRITVRRIPFDDPTHEFDLRRWPAERAADPVQWLKDHVTTGLEFPERRFGHWKGPLEAAAEQIHRERPVDLVIGSANPQVVLTVGDHLHGRHGVPYVIDHRDAWRLNCYTGEEVGLGEPRIAELETRYMANAREIWFVNRAILEWHQAMYPQAAERMKVVENGFDTRWAPAPRLDGPDPAAPLRFSYVGSMSTQVPLAEFVEGWARARRLEPEVARGRARLYGPVYGGHRNRAALLAGARRYGVEHVGRIRKDEVVQAYADSDVLLLILAGGRFVTSGKVYEYLATGLPIVSVHDPSSGATDLLRDYPLWFPAPDLTMEGVAGALAAAARKARHVSQEERAASVAMGQRKDRYSLLRPHVEALHGWLTTRDPVPA